MKRIESSITIQRNIEDVFATVIDFDTHAKWRSGLIDAGVTSDGPVQVGTTYTYDMQVMGRKIETSGVVEAYELSRYYAWKASTGPFPMSGSVTCEEVPEGTRITDVVEADPGGFFKLAEPLIVKQQQARMERDLIQLKELLEKGDA